MGVKVSTPGLDHFACVSWLLLSTPCHGYAVSSLGLLLPKQHLRLWGEGHQEYLYCEYSGYILIYSLCLCYVLLYSFQSILCCYVKWPRAYYNYSCVSESSTPVDALCEVNQSLGNYLPL